MKLFVLAATAAFVIGGSAMAAAPSSNAWTTPQATAVSTDTCTSAKAKFAAAEREHPTSPNLAKAKTQAKAAAAACKSGKTADGIADYTAAVKLLTA